MLAHGISDIWTANMKVLYEFSGSLVQFTCYVMMLGTFVYTRLYVFPFVIIKQFYERQAETNDTRIHIISKLLIAYLSVLLLLHIFWTWLMIKGFYIRILGGRGNRSVKKMI